MPLRWWTALLLVALLVPGFDAALAHGAGSQSRHAVLVVIGDSLSTGNGLDDPVTQSWPAVLVRQHPSLGQLANLAMDGNTFDQAISVLNDIKRAVAAHPTLIIIWLGAADINLNGEPVGHVTMRLDQMLGGLAAAHARVFVSNYPDLTNMGFPPALHVYNRAMLPILARHHATLIDMYRFTQQIWGNPRDIQQDNTPHPTVAGSVAIAKVVYDALHHVGEL
jgi:lysophospholipase L1-like esterase